MKQKTIEFSHGYVAALRKHLKPASLAGLHPALKLGREAVSLGLETLELARIHEQSLISLELFNHTSALSKRAETFFAEAHSQIEDTHRAARETKVQLSQLEEALGQSTEELSDCNRQLQRGFARRKLMEDAAEKKRKQHNKCLEESLELQKRLRLLTHRVISAQEDDRKKISHELQDEIAQTLLGINVRLLSLKEESRVNSKGLKSEIASTQRLVVKSAQSVARYARELNVSRPRSAS